MGKSSPSNIHLNVPEVNDTVGYGPMLILGPHLTLLGLVSLGKLRGIEVGLKSSGQESCALWPLLLSWIMLLLPSDAVYRLALGLTVLFSKLLHPKWWVQWTGLMLCLTHGFNIWQFLKLKHVFGHMTIASKNSIQYINHLQSEHNF